MFNLNFSEIPTLDDSQLILTMKSSKFSLNENSLKNCILNEENLQVRNVAFFYQLANIFNFTSLYKAAFCYLERCFSFLAKDENFLRLTLTLASKIFSSSGLFITSEVEVFEAAENWLSYDFKERSKFGKQLLLKVRLCLLPESTLKRLKSSRSCFNKIEECNSALEEVLYAKSAADQNNLVTSRKSRYCAQKLFSVLALGGISSEGELRDVRQASASDFSAVKVLAPMLKKRYGFQAVHFKGCVYVFGTLGLGEEVEILEILEEEVERLEILEEEVERLEILEEETGEDQEPMPVEKYSPATNTWVDVGAMYDYRHFFCACAFRDGIYVIGGHTNSCLKFTADDCQFKEVARTLEARGWPACAVFEERVWVSGGRVGNEIVSSVECYDADEDAWTRMPAMVKRRHGHNLVVAEGKLFAIGYNEYDEELFCEVFDNISKTFVAFTHPCEVYGSTAFSVGSKIFVFPDTSSEVIVYDVNKDEWSMQPCELTNNSWMRFCVKLPFY